MVWFGDLMLCGVFYDCAEDNPDGGKMASKNCFPKRLKSKGEMLDFDSPISKMFLFFSIAVNSFSANKSMYTQVPMTIPKAR